MAARKLQLDAQLLRNRLKLRSQMSELRLRQKHPEADEFFEKYHLRPGEIREHAAKILTSGALAGSLLLSAPVSLPTLGQVTPPVKPNAAIAAAIDQISLAQSLQTILQQAKDWQLSSDQEKKISEKLKEALGIRATPELDGNRLPNAYGRMGAEQHLARFPGDYVENMAPGLGGWGYFARSEPEMTPELYDTEKYYVAVQTLYIPDWNQRTKYYVNWFKYRRVVVVNPANGKAVIAAVADAGPANWTGKHFGGSPEVMEYLQINYGQQNHPVVLFFLDDPGNKVPLGPLEYNEEENKRVLANQT